MAHERIEAFLPFRHVRDDRHDPLARHAREIHAPVAIRNALDKEVVGVGHEKSRTVRRDEIEFLSGTRAVEIQDGKVSGPHESVIERDQIGFVPVEQGKMAGVGLP